MFSENGMHTPRSEYQRQFKLSTFKKNLPAYYEHMAFRYNRRFLENAHTPWPIFLEEPEQSDSNSPSAQSSSSSAQNSTSASNPVNVVESEKCGCHSETRHHIHNICDDEISPDTQNDIGQDKQKDNDSLQEKDNDSEEDSSDMSQDDEETGKKNSYYEDKTDTSDNEQQNRKKVNFVKRPSRTGCYSKQKAKKSKLEKTQIPSNKRTRLRRPDRCQEIPTAHLPSTSRSDKCQDEPVTRPKTALKTVARDRCEDVPIARPWSAPITGKPPFASYGWANRSKHQTYNILASNDIHPDALKAKKLHALLLQQKKEHEEEIKQHKLKMDILFDKHVQKYGSSSWQSEYKQGYPTHNATEYSKVFKARILSARTAARKRCDWV